MIFEIYEDLLKDIRKYIRNNNLTAEDFIYIKYEKDIIMDFKWRKKEGYIKERIEDVIKIMEEE